MGRGCHWPTGRGCAQDAEVKRVLSGAEEMLLEEASTKAQQNMFWQKGKCQARNFSTLSSAEGSSWKRRASQHEGSRIQHERIFVVIGGNARTPHLGRRRRLPGKGQPMARRLKARQQIMHNSCWKNHATIINEHTNATRTGWGPEGRHCAVI